MFPRPSDSAAFIAAEALPKFHAVIGHTKVLLRKEYEVLARERSYFRNFDPFGDFDLIFGAAKQNLRIVETPVHHKARTFGETELSRFRDGWLLLKMVRLAYRKLKAIWFLSAAKCAGPLIK